MHIVTVILEANKGKEQSLKEALDVIAEKSRMEDSCLDYSVHQDSSNPAKFALREKWESLELHEEQFEKPYIKEFFERKEELLSDDYQVVMSSS